MNDILGERRFQIDEHFLKEVEFDGTPQFTGEYRFKVANGKSDKEKTKAAYLIELIFDLKLKGEEGKPHHSIAYNLLIYQESPPSGNLEVDDDDDG